MENATILCADCNNRKGDGPARYRVSLAVEESRLRRRERPSLQSVPHVPPGPWDEPGSSQPPRTPRGVQRAVCKQLPEWARAYYVTCVDDEDIPNWVRGLVASQYRGVEMPSYVRRLIEAG